MDTRIVMGILLEEPSAQEEEMTRKPKDRQENRGVKT
jgi:hypothetical protein